jgi:HlyD family secretion protein
MHIRSPIDASVLELHAKIGETAGSGADNALLVLGDTAHLQVRAEVEERDVRKIYAGQGGVVKSDAFPDRTFDARVSVIARALGAPQLSARGQRKQTDVDVLEVILDLDDDVPLLPGMRTDVLFREAGAMQKSSIVKTE